MLFVCLLILRSHSVLIISDVVSNHNSINPVFTWMGSFLLEMVNKGHKQPSISCAVLPRTNRICNLFKEC